MAVSLIGDGIYFVALAWQVYLLSNDPTALSLVGVAYIVPHLACLLLGGAVSDRFDRRRVMIASSIGSGLAIGAISALIFVDALELWQLWLFVALHGASFAFFVPASTAIIPQLVPSELLVEANSLRALVRPLTLRFLGPALGGILIAAFGTGTAFLIDGMTFAFAAAAIFLVRVGAARTDQGPSQSETSFLREVADGLRFVRSQEWLSLSLVALSLWLFLTVGPIEVLIPFLVKNEMGGGADGLGYVLAAGGLGAVLAALLIGYRGTLPPRPIAFMYVVWAISTFAVAFLAISNLVWQAMIASFFLYGLSSLGGIVWQTLLQRRVPGELLGRVASLDWLASAGLVPVSFALAGPVAASAGAEATLFMAGISGGALMLAFLVFPALRAREGEEDVSAPAPAG